MFIESTGEVSISLTFAVEAGDETVIDGMGRVYRPKFVTVTLRDDRPRVEIVAVKVKKDGTDSLTAIDPFHMASDYPPFVLAAIEETRAYALKAKEANR